MAGKMSYRDYLLWEAASKAAGLTESITRALTMSDERIAISTLEQALSASRYQGDPNWERIEAKPTVDS